MEIIVIGVVIVCGSVAVIIFERWSRHGTDYGYRIPRTGTWGAGQKSPRRAIEDARHSAEHRMEIE